ncbi:PREDICTED: WD repeat-containing protein 25 [Elephantulus edwardii]|uniref:WD repeat-containing protein 25 n=1 Tax=Elephantulus edwardii TaxID=28737 RepID=UPI0003F09FF1|nr:PREDICTED: WD repeat-containing protein 25 [Elephantulus edwardii]
MASLVAYDDSDSDAEPEPLEGLSAAGQVKDACGAVTEGTPEPIKHRLGAPGSLWEGVATHRLPLLPLGRSDQRACPSQRLQWPRKEPAVTCPPREPPCPALWTSHTPTGHVPLAAACFKEPKRSWEACYRPEPAFCTQGKSEVTERNGSSSLKRRQDCVIPYTPKRLRVSAAKGTDTGAGSGVEPQDPSLGCALGPAQSRLAPRVSESIRPHLDSPYQETKVPRNVRFHLQGHGGPVNCVQWCPVLAHSHLLLSASMDKTLKVWDAVDLGRCLRTYTLHTEAVRAARWSPCGQRILSGGFDFTLHLTDLETGTPVFRGQSDFRITTLKFHPKDHNLCVCGGFSSEIKAWDFRIGKVVRGYKAAVQQTLDILFLQEGSEFLSSTDASSRDSADRTIIAWDFRTSAKISNQIFHERYTCPSLTLHPREPVFLAQTNGNYLALFSAVWPYRMCRRRRYEGHKVEGYSVGCECSPDGDLLMTGSADGRILLYGFRTASWARTLQGHTQACVGVTFHPVLPSVLASCSWDGDVKVWH